MLIVPFQLRFLFASYPDLMGKALGIAYRTIATWLIRQVDFTHDTARTGAVTYIQRLASALNLKVHFHMLFLDNFAHLGGRYSIINKLTGHRHQAMADPIAQWGEIANQIMQTQATRRERERAQMNERMASPAFGDAAVILISDLDQQHMNVAPLHVQASELNTAAKYAIQALVTLIDALCDSTWCGSGSAHDRSRQEPASLASAPRQLARHP